MSLCIAGARGLISLAAALMLCAGAGAAEPWDPGRIESLAGWRWAAPLAFDLPGGRMLVRRFRAPVAPVDAARRLAHAGRARFGQLQFSGAGLLLSGVQDGRHWLAQLQPAEAGSGETTGLLSSLEPGRRIDAGFDPVAFVPPDARPVLRASSRMGRAAGLLASYLCPGPYRRVDAAVRDALQGRHWQPAAMQATAAAGDAPGRARSAAGEWVRPDGARLTVHLHPRADAVVLTFWHRPKESS